MTNTFKSLYDRLQIAVIVCKFEVDLPIAYMNAAASFLFYSRMDMYGHTYQDGTTAFADIFDMETARNVESVYRTIKNTGIYAGSETFRVEGESQHVVVRLDASICTLGGVKYVVMYFLPKSEYGQSEQERREEAIAQILMVTYTVEDPGRAIAAVLELSGRYMGVDRTYVFERRGEDSISNTYEWCTPQTEPQILNMQELPIQPNGMMGAMETMGLYVLNDTSGILGSDRDFLDMRSVGALVAMPLHHADRPLGSIGFDVCDSGRVWTPADIRFIKSVADIVAGMINRRDSQFEARQSFEILKLISDSTDNLIYVSDINTHEIIFANKALQRELGLEGESLLGRKCWKTLQKGQNGPCPFCPVDKLRIYGDKYADDGHTWEFQNTISHKWYLAKDNIITWTNGEKVHIETATDITHRKQYEDSLQYYASMDAMTKVYNREWGYKILCESVENPGENGNSLCFVDIDNLKLINDTLGHSVGDELITQTINMLRSGIRQSDFICRWGGDEFIILMRCDVANAEKVMRKVQRNMDEHNRHATAPYKLSFSYGIVAFGGNGDNNVDAIISEADQLMYENKLTKKT